MSAPESAEAWDSGRHMAPDPSWPIEARLHWYQVSGHILLLNCSEVVRRKAAAAADREAQPAPDDAWRLTPAGQAKADAEAPRYALVEQMGHRSTVAAVREATFCGKPMLEMTGLAGGGVHLVSPESLYEVTWLTEAEARSRVKPWTAVAIGAGRDPWGPDSLAEDDRGDWAEAEEASYHARRAAEADL